MYGRIKRIHFTGIGGIGMSGIAEVLLNLGYGVSGSDLKRTDTVERLETLGARVFIGHRAESVDGADVVVTSSAVKRDNPEVIAALSRNIPVIPRAEMLAELMRLKYGIAVAGSHGKTTTTSMVSAVLGFGGFDPTIVVGGKVKALGTNARLGGGKFMVVEADESDGSFLLLSPVIAVVTNIDREHMDHYGDIESLERAFSEFINKIPFYGLAALCADCPRIRGIIPKLKKRCVTYGFSQDASFRAEDVAVRGFQTNFTVSYKGERLGEVRLNVPGRHNAQNSLAAVVVGMELGMSFAQIREGLSEFRGIERRLQVKGEGSGITVIDDYGHHPEEIKATLAALRDSGDGRRLVVIFQPHRYTRTHLLFSDFITAFDNADELYILDIYPAGETPIEGVNSPILVEAINRGRTNKALYLMADEALRRIAGGLKPRDTVLTLGAGDVWKIGERIVGEIL
ncbi:MAG: UDP-N-acetylmuramate--L-alanine ligase [Deltaproteobacteria bacterium]